MYLCKLFTNPLQNPENNSFNVKLQFVTFINDPNVAGSCLSPNIIGFTIRVVAPLSDERLINRFHNSS